MSEELDSQEIEIARRIFALQQEKDALEEKLDVVKNGLTLALDEMKCFLVDEGKASTGHIEGVGNFALKRDTYPSVPAVAMPVFLRWLEAKGDAGLIKRTVDPRILRKYLNERIEALARFIEESRLAPGDSVARVWTACKASVGMEGLKSLEWLYNQENPKRITRADLLEMDSIELATRVFSTLGVTSFTEYKVSHTGKGKSKLS